MNEALPKDKKYWEQRTAYGAESKATHDGNEGKSTKNEALTMVKNEKCTTDGAAAVVKNVRL